MKKLLFVCYTPYQIFVSSWLKYNRFSECKADIVINNKLKGYEIIVANTIKSNLFDNVIVWDDQSKNTVLGKVSRIKNEYFFAKKIIKNGSYDDLFASNFDFFIGRLFDFGKRKNSNFKFNYSEDGIASYSKKNETFYRLFDKPKKSNISHNNIFTKHNLFGNIENFFLFTPDLLEWNPLAKNIVKIEPIDKNDNTFRQIINGIFDFDLLTDKYDKKYIFFEESYYQDTGYMEDVELVEQLSQMVGKDNLMIKIHPRNQENRFEKRGYITNKNTVIPWEVIALNIDMDNKVLITIASSSIVNPPALFDCRVKTYSLINCLMQKPQQLSSQYNKTVLNFFNRFNNIKICNNIKEICDDN